MLTPMPNGQDLVGLDALPGAKWGRSACQRYRIYVSNLGIFVTPQVTLAALPGEKLA